MSKATKPRLPREGEYIRNIGKLVEIQDATPPPPEKVLDYIFESTEARVEARVNGKVIRQFSTFNDHYGEGTCVTSAIKRANEIQANFGDPSGVEFVVVKITSRCRRRPARDENFYDREFVDFAALDHGSHWELPDPTEEVVWSSLE